MRARCPRLGCRYRVRIGEGERWEGERWEGGKGHGKRDAGMHKAVGGWEGCAAHLVTVIRSDEDDGLPATLTRIQSVEYLEVTKVGVEGQRAESEGEQRVGCKYEHNLWAARYLTRPTLASV